MRPQHLEILVEERSIAAFLDVLLPKVLSRLTWKVHEHGSKRDLLTRLPNRLRGYRGWLSSGTRVLVLVDRDADDCRELKHSINAAAEGAGMITRGSANRDAFEFAARIVIEELESWYFGDWEAVRAAYPKVGSTVPSQEPFRDPDAIRGGTWEAFERVLQQAGYFSSGLRKVEAARTIADHIDPSRSRSGSFRAFRDLLAELDR
ncbi:MAG: DUF4276 family protein [Deltaproteobacteria bacterium]|nr:DUF4276 family protein [Deltaproteobacteria bacterium]